MAWAPAAALGAVAGGAEEIHRQRRMSLGGAGE